MKGVSKILLLADVELASLVSGCESCEDGRRISPTVGDIPLRVTKGQVP